jgi:uncharacterized delta-60 repeat protein
MRSQTRRLRGAVGVLTLTTTLFSMPATKSFAQASLIDSTFKAVPGASGELDSSSGVFSIVVQDDGKIIVGGQFTQIAGQACTNLARLYSDGQLDTSFPQGTDGAVYRLLKQADGKILIAGTFTNLQGVARRGIGRLLPNGMADEDFDAGNVIGSYEGAFSLGLQSDGKILVGTPIFSHTNSALFRLNANGQLDSGFVQTNIFDTWHIFTISPRTNGSILMAGGFQGVNGIPSPGLALLNTNGEMDLSFSSPFDPNPHPSFLSGVYSMAELPDGGFLIAGKFSKLGSTNYTVAKLTASLAWDDDFRPDAFDPDYESGVVMSVIRQTDGKFVLGGLFQVVGGYWRNNVVRLDAQGHVDPCFDPGLGLTSYGLGVVALAEQPSGKILAGGDFICFTGVPVATLSSLNLTRLLPQTDCGVTRVHLGRYGPDRDFVIATCAPGGTNHLQASTNLVDWTDITIPFNGPNYPYIYWELPNISTLEGALFFRVRKEH